MKKMMLMVAALVCVTASYGASLTWGTTTFFQPGTWAGTSGLVQVGTQANNIQFYLVYSADTVANVTAGVGGVSITDSVMSTANATKNGGSSKVVASAAGGTFTGVPSNPTTFNYYLVAVWNSTQAATLANAEKYWVSSVRTDGVLPNWASTDPGDDKTMSNFAGRDGTTYSTAWLNVVPEPTSLALLALGAAAIGLRRKNRK